MYRRRWHHPRRNASLAQLDDGGMASRSGSKAAASTRAQEQTRI